MYLLGALILFFSTVSAADRMLILLHPTFPIQVPESEGQLEHKLWVNIDKQDEFSCERFIDLMQEAKKKRLPFVLAAAVVMEQVSLEQQWNFLNARMLSQYIHDDSYARIPGKGHPVANRTLFDIYYYIFSEHQNQFVFAFTEDQLMHGAHFQKFMNSLKQEEPHPAVFPALMAKMLEAVKNDRAENGVVCEASQQSYASLFAFLRRFKCTKPSQAQDLSLENPDPQEIYRKIHRNCTPSFVQRPVLYYEHETDSYCFERSALYRLCEHVCHQAKEDCQRLEIDFDPEFAELELLIAKTREKNKPIVRRRLHLKFQRKLVELICDGEVDLHTSSFNDYEKILWLINQPGPRSKKWSREIAACRIKFEDLPRPPLVEESSKWELECVAEAREDEEDSDEEWTLRAEREFRRAEKRKKRGDAFRRLSQAQAAACSLMPLRPPHDREKSGYVVDSSEDEVDSYEEWTLRAEREFLLRRPQRDFWRADPMAAGEASSSSGYSRDNNASPVYSAHGGGDNCFLLLQDGY